MFFFLKLDFISLTRWQQVLRWMLFEHNTLYGVWGQNKICPYYIYRANDFSMDNLAFIAYWVNTKEVNSHCSFFCLKFTRMRTTTND